MVVPVGGLNALRDYYALDTDPRVYGGRDEHLFFGPTRFVGQPTGGTGGTGGGENAGQPAPAPPAAYDPVNPDGFSTTMGPPGPPAGLTSLSSFTGPLSSIASMLGVPAPFGLAVNAMATMADVTNANQALGALGLDEDVGFLSSMMANNPIGMAMGLMSPAEQAVNSVFSNMNQVAPDFPMDDPEDVEDLLNVAASLSFTPTAQQQAVADALGMTPQGVAAQMGLTGQNDPGIAAVNDPVNVAIELSTNPGFTNNPFGLAPPSAAPPGVDPDEEGVSISIDPAATVAGLTAPDIGEEDVGIGVDVGEEASPGAGAGVASDPGPGPGSEGGEGPGEDSGDDGGEGEDSGDDGEGEGDDGGVGPAGPGEDGAWRRGGQVKNLDLRQMAQRLEGRGRHGDTDLIHVSPEERDLLEATWGQPTINPETGLPEYFKFSKLLKKLAGVAAPLAAAYFTGGNPYATAAGGALGSFISGGKGTDILRDSLISGALAGGYNYFNAPAGADFMSATGLGNPFGGLDWGTASSQGSKLIPDFLKSAFSDGVPPGYEAAFVGGDGGSRMSPLASIASSASGSRSSNSDLMKKAVLGLTAVGALGSAFGGSDDEEEVGDAYKNSDRGTVYNNQLKFNRNRVQNPVPNIQKYGETGGEALFFDPVSGEYVPVVGAAKGGGLSMFSPGGPGAHMVGPRPVTGPGDGQSDSIPAMLSDGEFVMDAPTVARAGGGSTKAGFKKMEEIRNAIWQDQNERYPSKPKPAAKYVAGRKSRRQ